VVANCLCMVNRKGTTSFPAVSYNQGKVDNVVSKLQEGEELLSSGCPFLLNVVVEE